MVFGPERRKVTRKLKGQLKLCESCLPEDRYISIVMNSMFKSKYGFHCIRMDVEESICRLRKELNYVIVSTVRSQEDVVWNFRYSKGLD